MTPATSATLDLTRHWVGYASIATFVLAYAVVLVEEFTHLRKSKPVMLAAGIIWALIAWIYAQHGMNHAVEEAVRQSVVEYAELMLFLLAAMTFVNAMTERNVFVALRAWLIRRNYGYRKLFWVTGVLAFTLSPVIDNLTTALVLAAVVLALGGSNKQFIGLACINIVVAANAGGAFSPFGDITTLMVWQKGHLAFTEFFALFVPSLVNFLVPAVLMHFAVPNAMPQGGREPVPMKRGAKRIIALFVVMLMLAVSFHNFLHLPPFLGMMTGLALLKFFGYFLKRSEPSRALTEAGDVPGFDIFDNVARAEWDTLLFFFGVIFCVGGLGFIGYLAHASQLIYIGWGATQANIAIGVASAIVDNIPIMVAVLQMAPDMVEGQWLLVTLTAGVGGSLLSIGSAAGVALMGQSKGNYTFFGHLRWTPAIALGYGASIATHMWLNASTF
ncbi:MAG: sodium:proton antiporter [Lysobacterales bacterium CG17_big_fil_post_rev_8_21_14_2_50_64_11]|nr:MAG: sodium:proton antiporter [Xanthomonadales bacterium CG17_big_fil_post_rev_8_21_14_2_50_64_11]